MAKLTESLLRKIIREELEGIINEVGEAGAVKNVQLSKSHLLAALEKAASLNPNLKDALQKVKNFQHSNVVLMPTNDKTGYIVHSGEPGGDGGLLKPGNDYVQGAVIPYSALNIKGSGVAMQESRQRR